MAADIGGEVDESRTRYDTADIVAHSGAMQIALKAADWVKEPRSDSGAAITR